MSVNLAMETIDYCKMNPAGSARPGCQESNPGEDVGDNHYANLTRTGQEDFKRRRLKDYASLRKSKIDERNYMQIKVQNEATDDSEKAHLKKTSDFKRALCCVVVYVTVTFVITSTLLAYTVWTVADLRNDYDSYCTDFGRKVDEIHGNISALQGNVTSLHENYTRNISELEQSVHSLQSEVDTLHSKVDSTYHYAMCVNNCFSYTQCTVSL